MGVSLRVGVAAVVAVVASGCSSTGDGAGPTEALGRPGALWFTEVTEAAGLNTPHTTLDLVAEDAMSSGAAVADVDGDGHLDVFITRIGAPNSLYLNDGNGVFTDVAAEAGVAGPTDRFGSSAAAFADFDGDGHLDLFVTGYGQGENQLFMSNGDGTFREESRVRGLEWPPLGENEKNHSYGVAVADVDGDGHMDLLVLHWHAAVYNERAVEPVIERWYADGEPIEPGRPQPCDAAPIIREAGFPRGSTAAPSRSRLFLNDGAGFFRDATAEWGLPIEEMVAFTGTFIDIDGDGWVDLGITGDGCTSRLFRNVDGRGFEDITEHAGVGTDENGMGAVMRDLTGNGHPDWFITSIADDVDPCPTQGFFVGCSGNRLFANRGDGTFSDETDAFGVRDGGWGWGVVAEDFNNDGRIEIAMNNGFRRPGDSGAGADTESRETEAERRASFEEDPTRFWLLGPSGTTYVDVAAQVGITDTTVGHALIAFDMNGNGRLDLLSVPTGGPPRLWRNDSSDGNAWLRVRLDDAATPGNRWGDGARIEVTAKPGDAVVVGWIGTSGSYESQLPAEFHLGLGDHTGPLHRVEVRWPSPRSATQVLEDVEPNQVVTIRPDDTGST